MSSFTSGEKRGLIALAVLLLTAAFVVLWAGGNLSGRNAGDVAADAGTELYVEPDSVGATTTNGGDSLQEKSAAGSVRRAATKKSGRRGVKKKSARQRASKPLPPPRRPLDQPVN